MSSPFLPMRPQRLSLDTLAALTRTHPELLRRFADLGIVTPSVDGLGRLWFTPDAVDAVRRAIRLRNGLGLSYSAVVVVAQLLDRIDVLENRRLVEVRNADPERKDAPWI